MAYSHFSPRTLNPYTRIRQQAGEIATCRTKLQNYEEMLLAYKKKSESIIRSANMDIHLLMKIIMDVSPWVYPGALDSIVEGYITTRGISPVTMDLLKLTGGSRQGCTFVPIAIPIEDFRKKEPSGQPGPAPEVEREEEFLFGEEESQ